MLKRKLLKLLINIENINEKYDIKKSCIKHLIKLIFVEEEKNYGLINVIFVDHDYIIKLNKRFLNKSSSTDVLSFLLSEPDTHEIEGEIYINLDLVSEHAIKFKIPFEDEMKRVIIHGVLHLLGYNDLTKFEKESMTKKEDFYLSIKKYIL